MGKVIGMDIGGTNLRVGYVDESGNVLYHKVVPSRTITEGGDAVRDLIGFLKGYVEECGEAPEAMAIGIPAVICDDEKTVFQAPNLKDPSGKMLLDKTNLADPISEAFGVPVWIVRDTYCLLYADRERLGLQNEKIIAAGYIGTGYGGGVMIDGKILFGKGGLAMDFGHFTLHPDGKLCRCGKKGCLEAYASGIALQDLREEYFPDTEIGDMFTKHRDDPILKQFVRDCALPMSILGTILSPDVYLLGDGVVEMNDFPMEDLLEAIKDQAGHGAVDAGMRFVISPKDSSKGVFGAGIYAREHLARM
ncbi:MAG: ROK family protein [Lachnospiraceae bacterium]|nr:ROK family protein [Lachnospiraceae bacterium]